MNDAIFWFLLIFSVSGLINTIYLTVHVFTKTPVKCLWFPPEWCKKVQYSKWSRTFGIPNPIAGFGFYAAIFALDLLFYAGILPFWPVALVIGVGFLFSVYFTIIQGAVLKAYCTWCVLSALDFLLLAIGVAWYYLVNV